MTGTVNVYDSAVGVFHGGTNTLTIDLGTLSANQAGSGSFSIDNLLGSGPRRAWSSIR